MLRVLMRSALIVASASARALADPPPQAITVGGYIEEYYQLDFENPSNRITNLRGFDNRSRTFTLSNVALDTKGESGPIAVHLVLQVGHTASTYYLVEPALPGANGANTTNGELWKYVQAANITAKAPSDFVIEAGLFPSPIGPEVLPVKDNWAWSRSNLFFGLPFYHTGAMVSHPLGGGWTGKLHVYNGWSSVTDNNGYPSVAASAAYANGDTTAQLLYFGGIERGTAWRNLFDAIVQVPVTDELTVLVHGDTGVEPNDVGTAAWVAGAVSAKYQVCPEVYVAARGDVFYEKVAGTPIFWPVQWVAEGTATVAYQPIDHASVRLEYRHDHAAADAYFGGTVATDVTTGAYVPNRRMQDTLTLGVTAWF